jgi:hypothetical protein
MFESGDSTWAVTSGRPRRALSSRKFLQIRDVPAPGPVDAGLAILNVRQYIPFRYSSRA